MLTEGESYPVDVIVYATGTNLAHGGSLIFHSECQMRYIMGCLKVLIEGGHAAMECRQSVQDEYDERLQDALSRMVWSHLRSPAAGSRTRQGDSGCSPPGGSSIIGTGRSHPICRISIYPELRLWPR